MTDTRTTGTRLTRRGALAAAQHTEMVAFARSQVESRIADGTLAPRRVGRGIADL